MSFSILRACPCPHYTPGHTLSSLLRYTVLPLPPFIPNKEKSTASPCNLWPEPSIAFSLTTHPFQPQAWIIADNKGGARGCQDSAIVTSSEDYSLWLHPTTHVWSLRVGRGGRKVVTALCQPSGSPVGLKQTAPFIVSHQEDPCTPG